MPERIQLRRTKGWRKPPGAVVVSRPSRWGNPFRIGMVIVGREADDFAEAIEWGPLAREQSVALFRSYLTKHEWPGHDLAELRGKDLACWCPVDQPCHADVLLEVANGARRG